VAFATPALVAEDDPTHRFVISSLLRRLDIETQLAVDGRRAVEMAAALRPRIVFMDYNMPEMDGAEATRRIKAAPETAEITVVVVTADATERTRSLCMDAGCDAIVVKPLTMERIKEIMENVL
jgi:CheY-like chemotaxis protein